MDKLTTAPTTSDDRALIDAICARCAQTLAGGLPLFTTATADLWGFFLDHLPPALRQTYTCHACRAFMRLYGGLVTLDDSGQAHAVMWGQGPGVFADIVSRLRHRVEHAKVTGLFFTEKQVWGTPHTGVWEHFAVTPPPTAVWTSAVHTPRQARAAGREEYRLLRQALAAYPRAQVAETIHVLTDGQLARSNQCLDMAHWLLTLHDTLLSVPRARHANLCWRAVATAPPGYCHVKTTVLGTLLDDLKAEVPFHELKRRFETKMHPLQYQRPSAPPALGNIAQAEIMVDQLGLRPALQRRFGTLADIPEWVWRPTVAVPTPPATEGAFAHLRAQQQAKSRPFHRIPARTMTWVKFAADVLEKAQRIRYLVPRQRANYVVLVTAADPDAPPILQWDSMERRNPVSWYLYYGGASPERFGLTPGAYQDLDGIITAPSQWYGQRGAHQGIMLMLRGAEDTGYTQGGLFFPEILRSECRPVRATLEAYATQGVIQRGGAPMACGLYLQHSFEQQSCALEVMTQESIQEYILDRWD